MDFFALANYLRTTYELDSLQDKSRQVRFIEGPKKSSRGGQR